MSEGSDCTHGKREGASWVWLSLHPRLIGSSQAPGARQAAAPRWQAHSAGLAGDTSPSDCGMHGREKASAPEPQVRRRRARSGNRYGPQALVGRQLVTLNVPSVQKSGQPSVLSGLYCAARPRSAFRDVQHNRERHMTAPLLMHKKAAVVTMDCLCTARQALRRRA